MNAQETKKYTLNDIAKELGLNKSTVSRAISGKGAVSPETREKVLAFIQKCHFQPNAVAKSLAKNKTYNLGLVLPKDQSLLEPLFFQDCIIGICEVAYEHDYDVLISMANDESLTQLERVVSNHKVDGIIVTRSTKNSRSTELIKKSDLPMVVIGPPQDYDISYIDNDNQGACQELTGLLLKKGIKKIALLGGNENHLVTQSRFNGFLKAHQKEKTPLNEKLIYFNIDEKTAEDAVQNILAQKTDCIICMDDVICGHALLHLQKRNVRIPQDIRLASFYDSGNLNNNFLSITSLKFDTKELGRTACRKILSNLKKPESETIVLSKFKILWGDSTN